MGGASDGVSTGYGIAHDGRPVTVWAQDATCLGGTVGSVHARKITQMMEYAIKARTPLVGMFDSAGVRAADAVQYPDFFSTSSMAYFQSLAGGVIPRISLIMGPCTGDLALVAGLSDFVFMVRNTSFAHLMPSFPTADSHRIGDPMVQAGTTGFCDVLAENDEDCLQKCRQLLSYLPSHSGQYPPAVDAGDDPNRREEGLMEIVPMDAKKTFNMYKLIEMVVDRGEYFEIKRQWARNLITVFARLDGHTAGIIANNPQQMGGALTLDAGDKMSRFVHFCDAFNIPVIWLADTGAFLPAIEEETRGLIRHGARTLQVNSTATVPQITVAVRKHFGGGKLALPGLSLGGDIYVSWPSYQAGLMGGEGATAIVHGKELDAIKDEEARAKKRQEYVAKMDQGKTRKKKASSGAQDTIDPRNTRPFLIQALHWLREKKVEMPERKHDNFRM